MPFPSTRSANFLSGAPRFPTPVELTHIHTRYMPVSVSFSSLSLSLSLPSLLLYLSLYSFVSFKILS